MTRRENLHAFSRHPRIPLWDIDARQGAPARKNPYWNLISLNRHLGYEKRTDRPTYWVARYKNRDGQFRQQRLGLVADDVPADGVEVLSHEQALTAANEWFRSPEVSTTTADARPLGPQRSLIYTPVGDVYTVAHAIEELIDWKRLANAPSHVQVILSLANHHILPRVGTLVAEELDARTARRFVQDILEAPPRSETGRTPVFQLDTDTLRRRRKTANAVVSILRQALRLAWEDGHFSSDRCWRVLRQTRLPHHPRALFLSRAETTALLEAAPGNMKRLILGALYTGCRVGELLRMTPRDVGREGFGVTVHAGKTQHGRLVFLPNEGMAFFQRLMEARDELEPLFTRASGEPWTASTYRPAFRKVIKAAGIDPAFCFHSLRHTYASQLIKAGATFNAVADQLGHANTVTVMRTYGHLSPQSREVEVEALFETLDEEFADIAGKNEARFIRMRESARKR